MTPLASSTSIGFFPRFLGTLSTLFLVFSEITIPYLASTNLFTGTGLKKCIPTTLSGLLIALPTSVIDNEDLFIAI
jgi:hypothetical protein